MPPPLIELRDVSVTFRRRALLRRQPEVQAVVHASLRLEPGMLVALVGESGCGKTTLGRVIAGLIRPTHGQVLYHGQDIWHLDKERFRAYRRSVQLVHQDSFAALNPMRTIFQSLSAPLRRHGLARGHRDARARAAELLAQVGLTPPEQFLDKYPHQLSGGQRQRVVLARTMTVRPQLIVADEPVSMVDVSLRLSLLDLMARLNREMGIAFLYITHDLATARYLAQTGVLAVMYLGELVEMGPLAEVLAAPRHPYLQVLLSAVPVPDPRLARSRQQLPLRSPDMPDATQPPPGCRFHPRCPYAEARCEEEIPLLRELERDHWVACHLAERIPAWNPFSDALLSTSASSSSSSP